MSIKGQRSGGRTRSPIGKSLDTYYRDGARTARMDHLNATLVDTGALVFDIGSHVGDRADSFSRLGARVVALEPQPNVFRALRLILGRRRGIILQNVAIGAQNGSVQMHINSANPTVSTASNDLIAAAKPAEMWQGQHWDQTVTVPVITLDSMIAEHGLPDFVKIDVEGFEHEALKGLSVPLPLLSFEFTTIQRDVAIACVDCMIGLGDYVFNYSLGEEHRLIHDVWVSGDQICTTLRDLPQSANSGDIFVRRV